MTEAHFPLPDDSLLLPELETIQDAQLCEMEFEGGNDWAIRQGWFGGGLSDGVELIELCSGPLSVWILPTRGMGIWRAEYDGIPVGWNSPVRHPVHPFFVNLQSRNGLGWLDGFNELICRCGLAFNGPPGHDEGAASPIESNITLHGRIANIPAHSVTCTVDGSGELKVSGVVEESTLFGPNLQLRSTVTTRAGSNSFRIRDEVINLSSKPAELQLLYHTNIGPPFLDAGATLHCPAKLVVPRDGRAAEGIGTWPTYLEPTPGYAEQAYFFELRSDDSGRTLALLRNQDGSLGFCVRHRPDQLPCFTQWKCTQPEADGYVTGLEPGTNYPNFKSFERRQDRVKVIPSGGTYVVDLEFEILVDPSSVERVADEITALQGSPPKVFPIPTDPYCNVE